MRLFVKGVELYILILIFFYLLLQYFLRKWQRVEKLEAESSHASETHADEDGTDGESQESEESTAAQIIDDPPRKRGRPSYPQTFQ